MDSKLPEMAYDNRGTNASLIADVLRELPVSLASEPTTSDWHRETEVRRLDPSLIIIDSSAFYSRTTGADNADRLLAVLDALQTTRVRFLIYTRLDPVPYERVLAERLPSLKARVHIWQVPGGANASFRDPQTQRKLKELVTRILAL
jgi:hypothetical protein